MKITYEILESMGAERLSSLFTNYISKWQLTVKGYTFVFTQVYENTWTFNEHIITNIEEILGCIAEDSERNGRNSLRRDLHDLLTIQ